MIKKEELIRFTEDVQIEFNEFKEVEGCRYLRVSRGQEEDLYLVFTSDSDGLTCKVAYNTDDLQCDFDYDWYMPILDEYSVVDTMQVNCELLSARELANRVLADVDFVVSHIEKYKEI